MSNKIFYMTDEDKKVIENFKVAGNSVIELVDRVDYLEKTARANQELIDGFASGHGRKVEMNKKTLGQAIADELENKQAEIKALQSDKNFKFSFELKTSGILLTSTHLIGNPQATYEGPAIAPRQAINFRDLIPTVQSPTGTLIFYQEGTVTNGFSNQAEGQVKGTMNYTWEEKKATSKYISAKTKFSKQLMYNLPFLQDTLTLELTRDFYAFENDYFFITAAGNATGINTATNPTPTADVEEIIAMIANQMDANFTPSFGLIKPQLWRNILNTKPNDYSLPAGTVVTNNGAIVIGGMPVYPASWAQSDHILIVDRNYIQRVETESLRIEFATQNEDDWIKNLICARIENFETINLLRPESLIYRDFSNS
jgi:hypothetical protein